MNKSIKLLTIAALVFSSNVFTFNTIAFSQAEDPQIVTTQDEADLVKTAKIDTDIVSRVDWGADDDILTRLSVDQKEPRRIVVIELEPLTKTKSSQDFIRELYYFFSFKMGLGDLPFHFIIDSDGKIFEGNSTGMDATLVVEGYESGDIIIGYINNPNEELITQEKVDRNIESSIVKILDRSFVVPSSLTTKNLSFVFDLENKASSLSFTKLSGGEFYDYIDKIKVVTVANYKVPERRYSVELVSSDYPKDVKPDSVVDVKVDVKNTGPVTIYHDGGSEIYASTDKSLGKESQLYINQVWDTRSLVSIMNEADSVLSVGESKTFSFKVNVPLISGEFKEDFVLVDKFGKKFDGTEFVINFNIDLGDLKVLEIKETETGFLRVRAEGAFGAEEVAQVIPGERFIYEERNDNGWYKIKLGEEEYGWISAQYATIIK